MPARTRRIISIPPYTVGEEISNAVSHGFGALLSAAALVLLLVLRTGADAPPEGGMTGSNLQRTEDGRIIILDGETGEEGEEAEETTFSFAAPEQEKPADATYFSDAAFVGNETVAALGRYDYDGLLTGATFYEVETVSDSSYARQLVNDGGYGKVYIGLGGHELAWHVDSLRDGISSAIDTIRADNPDCVIYLMSVTPVSKYRESVSHTLRMDRLPEYNEMLSELASEKGAWYIEVTSALVNEEGYLPSEETEDGINFTPRHYEGWYERIAAQYVGDTE